MTWHSRLTEKYGSDRVEDIVHATPMQNKAEAMGWGLHIIRNFVPKEKAQQLMKGLSSEIQRITLQEGCQAVQIKGGRLWYESLQILLGQCICEYKYHGTRRNKTFRASQIPVMEELNEWLHKEHGCNEGDGFHQIVANLYSRTRNESTPWHSDANMLLKDSTEVLCIYLGAPGIYCFQPNRAHVDERWGINMSNKMKGDKLRQTCIDLKLRGCAPLFAGDLLFSTGTFMRHCEHKEFKYNDLPDGTPEKTHQIIRRYPATTIASRQQLHQPDHWINAPQTDGTDTKQNRGVVTFRKTDNHWHNPRCPELPAVAVLNNVHTADKHMRVQNKKRKVEEEEEEEAEEKEEEKGETN